MITAAFVMTLAIFASVEPAGASAAPASKAAEASDVERVEAGLLARLREIDERAAKIRTLRADFVQRKKTALLKEPLESSGKLVMKGEAVRWDTARPRKSTLVSSRGEIRVYFPEARVVEVYASEGDLRELSASPIPRLETLLRSYDIRVMEGGGASPREGKSAGGETLAIELTPTSEGLKEHVQRVEVVLDVERACVRRLTITDVDDERTEIEFSNVRIDEAVKDEEVALSVPEGTRVSRPSAVGGAAGDGAKKEGAGAGDAEKAKPGEKPSIPAGT